MISLSPAVEANTDEHLTECLRILQEQFEAGDKSALLNAIYHCLLMRRPLPEGLRLACLHAYEAHTRFEIRSWGDVFGLPVPKGTHLETEKRNADLRIRVIELVRELGGPMEPDLFSRIGKKLGIVGSTASSLYYDERGRYLRELDAIADRIFGTSEKI